MHSTANEYTAVTEVIHRYFDGLYNGDVGKLRDVFHDKAHLVTVNEEGAMSSVDVPAWLDIVSNRESSAQRGDTRFESIDSVEFGSANTASVRVRCALGPKLFTDFLSLVKTSAGWQVAAKVYQFEAFKS